VNAVHEMVLAGQLDDLGDSWITMFEDWATKGLQAGLIVLVVVIMVQRFSLKAGIGALLLMIIALGLYDSREDRVRVVEESHWDGLPTGKGRRTTTGDALPPPRRERPRGEETGPLRALLNRAAATHIEVGRRPLTVYDELTGTRPFTTHPSTRATS
jgi:hypothetical protein